MIDREVEAISDFLRHFGSFRCRQICVRRAEQLLREAAASIPRIGGGHRIAVNRSRTQSLRSCLSVHVRSRASRRPPAPRS